MSFVHSIPWGFVSMIVVFAMLAVPFFPSKHDEAPKAKQRSAGHH
jgi:hypothetical protein